MSARGHFYARHSAGKYPLDVDELRDAFLRGQALQDRIRAFRRTRVDAISRGDTPAAVIDGARYAFHIIPLAAFAGSTFIPMPALRACVGKFAPFDAAGWTQRSNLDGYVLHMGRRGQPATAYTQVYRNGCVESVMVYDRGDKPTIYATWQEQNTIRCVTEYIQTLMALDVPPPFYVFLSLTNALAFTLNSGDRMWATKGDPLDRDMLLLPEVTFEEPEFNAGLLLKPVFDTFWHAFNCPNGTLNVDEAGEWKGPR